MLKTPLQRLLFTTVGTVVCEALYAQQPILSLSKSTITHTERSKFRQQPNGRDPPPTERAQRYSTRSDSRMRHSAHSTSNVQSAVSSDSSSASETDSALEWESAPLLSTDHKTQSKAKPVPKAAPSSKEVLASKLVSSSESRRNAKLSRRRLRTHKAEEHSVKASETSESARSITRQAIPEKINQTIVESPKQSRSPAETSSELPNKRQSITQADALLKRKRLLFGIEIVPVKYDNELSHSENTQNPYVLTSLKRRPALAGSCRVRTCETLLLTGLDRVRKVLTSEAELTPLDNDKL